MTVKLFWEDAYLCSFAGRVVSRCEHQGHPAVMLDQTCFYATSGGQPHDVGTLNEIPVTEVIEQGDDVLHVLARPLDSDDVQGEIDWPRRFDHMQQHTGQHILSQAFIQTANAETVSFHLGAEAATIDVAVDALTAEQIDEVERRANAIVMSVQPVSVTLHPPGSIQALALRKQPEVEGEVRVVQIGDFDRCACGGTHVRNTGEIGPIHISRWDSQRGNTRVEFLCGWRALRDYAARDALLRTLARDLSVGWSELPERYARIQEQEREARRQVERLRQRLLDAELPRLAAQAEQRDGYRLLVSVLQDYDAGNMRYLAQQLLQEPGMVVLLGVTEPAVQFCMGRSANLAFDMRQVLRRAGETLPVRGGGKPEMVQGGGINEQELDVLLRLASEAMTTA